ncbi:MAG: pyridoxamine 5'-phosphate oxidase [Chloroflexi bacterium]|nr:pyridoxamine 5'-phosphate oxidase [Chloroflexota bacterium]
MSIADLRREYTQHGLSETEVAADPFAQFRVWFDHALAAQLPEPNAMTLATATPDGKPSARVVLLKGFDQRGFVFYTNYHSRKGGEIEASGWAALVFFWPDLERQVRVEGRVERVSPQESDDYFASRPAGSRLGAWASPQSQVISGRDVIEQRLSALTTQYADQDVPRPPHWGGYRVVPGTIEFWQGRPNRLHDRLRYRLSDDQRWTVERLAP